MQAGLAKNGIFIESSLALSKSKVEGEREMGGIQENPWLD
jgi:hypothetical protein